MNLRFNREKAKKLIVGKGIKQSFIADALGVHQMTITRYMTGNTQPKRSAIRDIARLLGVSENELMIIE